MTISLLERLNEGVSRPSNSFSNEKLSRSLPPSSQYALSKVIEKMLALNLITLDQAKAMEDLSPNGDAS